MEVDLESEQLKGRCSFFLKCVAMRGECAAMKRRLAPHVEARCLCHFAAARTVRKPKPSSRSSSVMAKTGASFLE